MKIKLYSKLLLLLLLLSTSLTPAQVEEGNLHFNNIEYHSAIRCYLKAIKKDKNFKITRFLKD